jgi:hypothetical protein
MLNFYYTMEFAQQVLRYHLFWVTCFSQKRWRKT